MKSLLVLAFIVCIVWWLIESNFLILDLLFLFGLLGLQIIMFLVTMIIVILVILVLFR
jgi:hypothetical protein